MVNERLNSANTANTGNKISPSIYIYICYHFLKTLGGGGGGGVGGLVSVRNTYTGRLARVSPNLVTGKTWKVDFHDLMIFTSSQSTSKMVLDFP